ncbi:MAG TPA: TetR/AcrR family transcriptional regulator [Bacteroidales bacterium]|nr:TetR/AcrR family transcriptional regulator [Bacteroidales bacterium]
MNDTKEHIILIASRLFLEKNFKEVTMKDIVDKTGLSKGAFYHYFESKEQLFLEVLEYFFQFISRDYDSYSKESFYQFYNDYANDTLFQSRKYLEKFNQSQNEGSGTMNYFLMMFDALKLLPEFRERAIEGFNRELEYWTKAAERGRISGEIKSNMTDREIGETFMYLSDGVGMHMILRGVSIENMVKPFKQLWDKLYEEIKA